MANDLIPAQKNEIVVYQPNASLRLDVSVEDDTVWLTQAQMVELFERDQSVIARHIRNAFKEGEVSSKSNMHFLHNAISDKPVKCYDLEVIISVGYRRFRVFSTTDRSSTRMSLPRSIFSRRRSRFSLLTAGWIS